MRSIIVAPTHVRIDDIRAFFLPCAFAPSRASYRGVPVGLNPISTDFDFFSLVLDVRVVGHG